MSFRLLLIEDDPISQEVIRALLAGQGHHVEVAADGFGALEKLAAARFDAALVDYHLPEMDGFALGRLIRDERRAQGTPPVLIGLTADRNGLAARRGSDAVFRAILPKPVEPAELFATLDRLLASEQPAQEAGTSSAPLAPPSLWKRHGLARAPRAFVAPDALPDQVSALSLCFDLVPSAEAEMVLLIERHGIKQALCVARPAEGRTLPIVGVSADLADICDLVFKVADQGSWRTLAERLGAGPVEAVPLAVPAPMRLEPVVDIWSGDSVSREPDQVEQPVSFELPRAELRAMLVEGVARPLAEAVIALDGQGQQGGEKLRAAQRALDVLAACLAEEDAPEAMRAIGDTAPIEPLRVVEGLLDDVDANARARGLSFELRVEAGLPSRMDGDGALFGDLVSAMLDEAVCRWADGPVQLHLGLNADSGRVAVRLITADAVPAEDRPPILQRLGGLRARQFRRLVVNAGGELPRGEDQNIMPSGFALPARPIERLVQPVAPDGADNAVAAIDRAKRDALMGVIGIAAVERLSRHLVGDVELLSRTESADRWSRLSELSACAAMLGFDELAAACSRTQAPLQGAVAGLAVPTIDRALERVRAVLADASAAA